jgi:hypothetical protein
MWSAWLFACSPTNRSTLSIHNPKPLTGQELRIGAVHPDSGVRGYLAVAGGIDVPSYLGSKSTFPSGKFGGYQGRYLRPGDSLPIGVLDAKVEPIVLPKVGRPGWAVGRPGGGGDACGSGSPLQSSKQSAG